MKKVNYFLIALFAMFLSFSMSCSVHTWTEKDNVIRFSVTSDGTTGEQWITRLESKGFFISVYAKGVLRSEEFKPAVSPTTYEIAI
jgi:hypothetical protein